MLVYQRVRSHRPCDGKSPMFAGGERKTIMSHKEFEKNGGQVSSSTRFFLLFMIFGNVNHILKKGVSKLWGYSIAGWFISVKIHPKNG